MYFKKSKLFFYIINDPCDKKNHKLLIKNNIYIQLSNSISLHLKNCLVPI